MTTAHDATEGARRRDSAHAILTERRAVYVRRGQHALLGRLLTHGTATADDVRDAITLPPAIGPRCLGAVPGPLARARIIRRIGYRDSARPTAHARPVSVWALADRAAAVAWLSAHPDPDAQPLLYPV